MKPLPFLASALTGILLAATLSGPALAASPETHTNTPGTAAAGVSEPTAGLGDAGTGKDDTEPGAIAVDPAQDVDPAAADTDGTPSETTVDAQTDEVTELSVDSSDVTIIGATWEEDRLEIRTRDGNGWSEWESLPTDDEEAPTSLPQRLLRFLLPRASRSPSPFRYSIPMLSKCALPTSRLIPMICRSLRCPQRSRKPMRRWRNPPGE